MFVYVILGDFYVYQCNFERPFIVNLKKWFKFSFLSLSLSVTFSLAFTQRIYTLSTGPKGGGQGESSCSAFRTKPWLMSKGILRCGLAAMSSFRAKTVLFPRGELDRNKSEQGCSFWGLSNYQYLIQTDSVKLLLFLGRKLDCCKWLICKHYITSRVLYYLNREQTT